MEDLRAFLTPRSGGPERLRLLGLISENEATMLRALKEIRNLFAHRLEVTFGQADVQKALKKLYEAYLTSNRSVQNKQRADGKIDLGTKLATDSKAMIFLIQLSYGQLAHGFHGWLSGRAGRIDRVTIVRDPG
jgi:hypothetical protein